MAGVINARALRACRSRKPFRSSAASVLHYRCLTGKAEMILDFTRAGRDPFLALLALDKIENAPLPLGQHVCIIVRADAEGKFK